MPTTPLLSPFPSTNIYNAASVLDWINQAKLHPEGKPNFKGTWRTVQGKR